MLQEPDGPEVLYGAILLLTLPCTRRCSRDCSARCPWALFSRLHVLPALCSPWSLDWCGGKQLYLEDSIKICCSLLYFSYFFT